MTGDPAAERPEELDESNTPDPRSDPAGALDALEERVLGALPDPARDHENDEDETGDDEDGPRADEPPS
jgi:hypothetical protein